MNTSGDKDRAAKRIAALVRNTKDEALVAKKLKDHRKAVYQRTGKTFTAV